MGDPEILETLYSLDAKERVQIFRRDSATFGYANEYLGESGSRPGWIGLGLPLFCSYDSAEAAQRAARANVLWLLLEARNRKNRAEAACPAGPLPVSPTG
jgi:hypothetical protein